MMHGAAPTEEHIFPLSVMVEVQQFSLPPERPPQPEPPHEPQEACGERYQRRGRWWVVRNEKAYHMVKCGPKRTRNVHDHHILSGRKCRGVEPLSANELRNERSGLDYTHTKRCPNSYRAADIVAVVNPSEAVAASRRGGRGRRFVFFEGRISATYVTNRLSTQA